MIQSASFKAADLSVWPRLKGDVVANIDFWEKKFKEHKKTLGDVVTKFA